MGQVANQIHAIPAHNTLLIVASEFWLPVFTTAADRPAYCHQSITAILPGTKMPGGSVHHPVVTDAPGQVEQHILSLIENDALVYRTRPEWGPEGNEEGEEIDDFAQVGALLVAQREADLFF